MQFTVNWDNWNYLQDIMKKHQETDPQSSFADGIAQAQGTGNSAAPSTTSEVLEKLSGDSVDLLKSMKAGNKNVDQADWAALMAELRDAGAITPADYIRNVKPGSMRIPLPGIGHYAPGEKGFREMYREDLSVWPGDPLEKMENAALYMRKWIGVLSVSRDTNHNPGSLYIGPFAEFEDSYLKVSKVVKDLMAAA